MRISRQSGHTDLEVYSSDRFGPHARPTHRDKAKWVSYPRLALSCFHLHINQVTLFDEPDPPPLRHIQSPVCAPSDGQNSRSQLTSCLLQVHTSSLKLLNSKWRGGALYSPNVKVKVAANPGESRCSIFSRCVDRHHNLVSGSLGKDPCDHLPHQLIQVDTRWLKAFGRQESSYDRAHNACHLSFITPNAHIGLQDQGPRSRGTILCDLSIICCKLEPTRIRLDGFSSPA